jgi:hypothetical protein
MITIPDSVTSIADFSFQYFDLTIHAGEGSYAAGYARKHRIRLKFKAVPGI